MAIKDLFGKKRVGVSKISSYDLDGVESPKHASSIKEDEGRIVPPIDFSNLSSFARFGSAEQYYEDTISRI